MTPLLSIHRLHKQYGRIRALDSLSLDIPAGQIFGLLGPNGSGKSTTLGIVLGVVNPTGGDFSWFGEPPSHRQRQRIGAILESPTFYPYLSARQNLALVARIKQTSPHRIDEVLRLVHLYERRDDSFKTYSLGMKQRLAIASALLADPDVLILDEPTNGLDPQGIAEVRSLITEVATTGKTILLASHLLNEVQKVCTHFAVLKEGKLLFTGGIAEALAGRETVEVGAEDAENLYRVASQYAPAESVERRAAYVLVTLPEGKRVRDLHQYLIGEGIVLTHLFTRQQNLEQQFLDLLANHA